MIFELDRTEMGCIAFPIWIGMVIGSVIIVLVIGLIAINRKWEAIKFFLFMKFDILTNDDEPEHVDDLEFDAFIAYRSVENIFHCFSTEIYFHSARLNNKLISLVMTYLPCSFFIQSCCE